MFLKNSAILLRDGLRLKRVEVDAGARDPTGHDLGSIVASADVAELGGLSSYAFDIELDVEHVPKANRGVKIGFGMDCGPPHTVLTEYHVVWGAVIIEEIFKGLVEEVEEAREVDDLRVVLVAEPDGNRSSKCHGSQVL